METLQITEERTDQMIIFKLSGRLDTIGARQLDNTLTAKVTGHEDQLYLDMKEIRFLSSAGIRVLVKFYKACHDTSGDLSLGNVPDQVVNVLKMVGLEQLILNARKKTDHTELEKQCNEFGGIRYEWWQLHNETAEICQKEISTSSEEAELLSLQPYIILTGQGYHSPKNLNDKYSPSEFLSIGNILINNKTGKSGDNFKATYYTGTNGSPSDLIHFTCPDIKSVSLSELIHHCMEMTATESAGVVIVADTAGITGCSGSTETNTPIKFVTYPAYSYRTSLITGIIYRQSPSKPSKFIRPLSSENLYFGHLHAAIYPLYKFKEEKPALNHIVRELTSENIPLGVFHLLNDNREILGCGQSRFYEGNIWLMKIK